MFCTLPFEELEIHIDGNVYTCCPSWNNYYSIGNINNQNLEEIWNSEKARELREKVLNNDYSLCNKERCFSLGEGKQANFKKHYDINYSPVMTDLPKKIKLCYDYECNLACIICRDKVNKLKDEELEFLNNKINTFFLPLFKNVDILTINTAGDAFGSRHSRKLIKEAAQKYPDLKFDFTTNGILCNKVILNKLNITPNKIDTIRVSVHAATKKTYGKMIKNGEKLYDTLMNNLNYLSQLKGNNNFNFILNFVVTSVNYKDMPKFVKLAQKLNAFPVFWEYKQDLCTNTQYKQELEITNPNHKEHKKLIKILHHPNMYIYKNSLYPILKNLQDTELNNPIKEFFKKLLSAQN